MEYEGSAGSILIPRLSAERTGSGYAIKNNNSEMKMNFLQDIFNDLLTKPIGNDLPYLFSVNYKTVLAISNSLKIL